MIELSPLAISVQFVIFGLGIIVGVAIAKFFSQELSQRLWHMAEDDYQKFNERLLKAVQKNFLILEESRNSSKNEISLVTSEVADLKNTFESIKSNMIKVNNQTVNAHKIRQELENEIVKLKNIIQRYEKRSQK